MNTPDTLAWVVLPYVTFAVFVVGHVWRYRYDQFGWTSRSSQIYESRLLRWGSPLFHLGILLALAGHVIGLVVPASWTQTIGISEHAYHLVAVTSGTLATVGLLLLIARRRSVRPVFSATTRMDKLLYVVLGLVILLGMANTVHGNLLGGPYDYRQSVAVWFRGVFRLHPDAALMAGAPFTFQAHAVAAMGLFALWPFTRLVHSAGIIGVVATTGTTGGDLGLGRLRKGGQGLPWRPDVRVSAGERERQRCRRERPQGHRIGDCRRVRAADGEARGRERLIMTITVVPGEALSETLDEVAAAYGVVSRLLLEPADEELLASLAAPGLLDTWPVCHCEESVRGLASLRRSIREPESVEILASDYRRLFVGPSSLVPPPCESAYRPTEDLRFVAPAVEVRDERQVFGLPVRPPGRREGDHLALELAVAGRLCLAAGEAIARGDADGAARALTTHQDLLAEHLLRWAPGCLREIEVAAGTHFYRGAAELALSVLTCAHERLG